MKYLWLILFIVLSGPAYAAMSTAVDVPITIMGSVSPSVCTSPPPEAVAAGFTTPSVCFDFTAPTGGVLINNSAPPGVNAAQTNTWLNCAGASSPIWFQGQN